MPTQKATQYRNHYFDAFALGELMEAEDKIIELLSE
jgi:hypothetical protein